MTSKQKCLHSQNGSLTRALGCKETITSKEIQQQDKWIFTLGSASSYLFHTILWRASFCLSSQWEGLEKGSRLKSHGCGPHRMRLGTEDTSVTSSKACGLSHWELLGWGPTADQGLKAKLGVGSPGLGQHGNALQRLPMMFFWNNSFQVSGGSTWACSYFLLCNTVCLYTEVGLLAKQRAGMASVDIF